MAYKILYIEDQKADSREDDLKNLGFEVDSYDPSPDLREVIPKTKERDAIIIDYRLTNGEKNAPYDAPTIAQSIRSIHSSDLMDVPIILMSNENIITDYYNNFTSQDLFDFSISKAEFNKDTSLFYAKLISFIQAYKLIKENKFNLIKIMGLREEESHLIHSKIMMKLNDVRNSFGYSFLIHNEIINAIGPLIDEDILSARLGVSKESKDWHRLLNTLKETRYEGIFSDFYDRWWMEKINIWWKEVIKSDSSIRRWNSEERVEILKAALQFEDLVPIDKTEYSMSTNFWTICQYSKTAIDTFDGVELLNRDYLPWQEKQYLSLDSAVVKIDTYKNYISEVDRKTLRKLGAEINSAKK
ncbi:hypothetical protein [Emticicia oligotrophica]|uniref:hypothetical protein n=1 Tax=Emticicia oligotrophica TaxID=312279 RepID=UPI00273C97C5|nr:hypothetical protein [Emticicia oligotrophica]